MDAFNFFNTNRKTMTMTNNNEETGSNLLNAETIHGNKKSSIIKLNLIIDYIVDYAAHGGLPHIEDGDLIFEDLSKGIWNSFLEEDIYESEHNNDVEDEDAPLFVGNLIDRIEQVIEADNETLKKAVIARNW